MKFLVLLLAGVALCSALEESHVVHKCNYDLPFHIQARINAHRADHGVGELKENAALRSQAQAWAEQLARANNGSSRAPNIAYGQLFLKKWFSGWPYEVEGAEVFEHWAQDYAYYGREPPASRLERYSDAAQLLWRDSKQVGFGCAYRTINDFEAVLYVVGFFDPPGNQQCQYKHNVLPVKNSRLYRHLTERVHVPEPSCVARRTLPIIGKDQANPSEEVVRQCNHDFHLPIANRINIRRQEHETGDLKENADLTAQAQALAEEITRSNNNSIRTTTSNTANLLYTKRFYNWPVEVNGTEAFEYWAQDYAYYGREPPVSRLARYSSAAQLLWRATKRVGFGCAYRYTNDNEAVLNVVAVFDPPGNQRGQYKQNVLPAKSTPAV